MGNSGCSRVIGFLLPIFCIVMVGYFIIGSFVTYDSMQKQQKAVIAEGTEYTAKIKKSDSSFARMRGVDNAELEIPEDVAASKKKEKEKKSGGFLDGFLGDKKDEQESDQTEYAVISMDGKVLDEIVGKSGEGTITAYYSEDYPDVYATQESLDRIVRLTNRWRVIMWIAIVCIGLVIFFWVLVQILNHKSNAVYTQKQRRERREYKKKKKEEYKREYWLHKYKKDSKRRKAIEWVKAETDPEILRKIALSAIDYEIRLAAIDLLDDEEALAEAAENGIKKGICMRAAEKVRDTELLKRIAKKTHDEDVAEIVLSKMDNHADLAEVAVTACDDYVRQISGNKVTDEEMLECIRHTESGFYVPRSLIEKADSTELLQHIAENAEKTDTRNAARDELKMRGEEV